MDPKVEKGGANQPIFQESQQFRNVFLLILLGALTVLIAWAIIQQIILGKPFGQIPAPDAMLYGILALILFIDLAFYSMKLKTRIFLDRIEVSFFPLVSKKVYRLNELKDIEVSQYKPLREFGGWGVRFGKGIAYSIAGSWGIILKTQKGKRIVIGTQVPDKAKEALSKINMAN